MSAIQELNARISGCTSCGLATQRNHAVPGEGLETAEVLFVGEGPGFHEDQQARPFVGPAGKFLDELLASIGLNRRTVFITNVVKCRPPGNRDPLPNEVDACRPFLEEQIARINPRVIVTLGRYSLAWFFPRDTISKVHGQVRERDGRFYVHMYHPAAALHAGNLRKVIEDDFRRIPQALEKARAAARPLEPAVVEPSVEQMRLF